MKIYVLVGEEEYGPYTKSDIFAFMKEGSVTPDMFGRWENESEWRPINDVLVSGGLGLFSIENIVSQQINTSDAAPLLRNSLARPDRDTPAKPKRCKPYIFALAVIIMAIWIGYTFFQIELTNTFTRTAVAPQPTQSPSNESLPKNTSQPLTNATPSSIQSLLMTDLSNPDTLAKNPSQNELKKVQNEEHLTSTKATPKPSSESPAQPTAYRIPIGTTPQIIDVQFWVNKPLGNPRAVLVICLAQKGNAQAVINDPDWLDFARDQKLALVAVKFSSPMEVLVRKSGYMQAEGGSAQMLFEGLHKAELDKLPMLVYGRDEGGTFASSLVNIAGNRIGTWAALTDTLVAKPQAKDNREALIGCAYEVLKVKPELKQPFDAGRDKNLKWTWLSVIGSPDERARQFEHFVRAYFATTLGNRSSKGIWVGIDTLEKMSSGEISVSPKTASWLPDEALLASWKEIMPTPDQQKDPILIEKIMTTKVASQPELNMFLRLPPGYSKEHPLKGILAFCTWDRNAKAIRKNLLQRSDIKTMGDGPSRVIDRLRLYADTHNMAILSWNTGEVWNKDANSDELALTQQKEFDRDFDKLANVWEKGLLALTKQNNLPDKDLLLFGMSRGAQWAHRLALRKPERFLAVYVHIPSSFDIPTPKANKVLWLVTTGELEGGYERAIHFYQACRKLNYPIIFKAIIGIGHDDSSIAEDLGYRFFDYALTMRDKRNVGSLSSANLSLRKPIISSPWDKDFRQPPFIGDLLNQEIFSLKEASLVPVSLQVPLPTDTIAQAWNK